MQLVIVLLKYLLAILEDALENKHQDLDITVKKSRNGDGAIALVDERCDIAIMSPFMKKKEYKI